MFSLPATWRQTSSKPISTRPARSRMIIFNIVRLSVYAAVFLFGLICLGMAGSFQHILAASDLTRFVPFALFVCSASLLGISILVLFGLMKERNPISTRGELLSFGFLGLLWFVLGIYLTTSESQAADVECFATPSSTSPLYSESASFHTEQYQAMYRVLMVFALMNAIIVILTSSLMLFLAVRKHRNGDQHMWYGPITSCAWLQSYSKPGKNYRSDSQKSILPRSHSRGQSGGPSRSHSRGAAVIAEKAAAYTEKPTRERSGRSTHTRHGSGRRPSQSKTTPTYATKIYDQHRRHGSGNGQGSIVAPRTNVDFENGAMVEPARAVNRDRHRN